MGSSSKVLLVGATSLIVGVYAISLKNVQTDNFKVAQSRVDLVQNERLVDAALTLALDKVKKTGGSMNTTVSGKKVLGGDVSYSITSANGKLAKIVLTVSKNGTVRRVNATVEKIEPSAGPGKTSQKQGFRKIHRGNWQVTSVFNVRG